MTQLETAFRALTTPRTPLLSRALADLRSPRVALAVASLAIIVAGLALGAVSWDWAGQVWLVGLLVTGAPIVWRTLHEAQRGRWATDVVAVLAIVAAAALREPLAGLVIVLMRSGGEALEHLAAGRASAALRELEAAAPRITHRLPGHATTIVEDIPVDTIDVGDLLLVRPGELVPCDGVVREGRSLVDASRLTGEPVPIEATSGTRLLSGSLNGDGALTLLALARAGQSQYARIVELVRSAQASKSPLARLADRYAVWFTPLTLLVCAAAYFLTGDTTRVLAVLVVATPCPLLLATPIAMIGGINRAARRQIIVRNGSALEALSRVDTAVFDKTGTLTIGKPAVSSVLSVGNYGETELLRLAGAVEQGSSHLLARTLVEAANARGISLPAARHHVESAGRGVSAEVEGREIAVGARSYVLERARWSPEQLTALERVEAGLRAYVAVDGCLEGVVEYSDQLRPGLSEFFSRLEALGIERTLLLSGDHAPNVHAVANVVGIGEARGDLLPADKVTVVRRLTQEGAQVLMVGDGTNDAPALSTAHVGIALASHGGGISAEAADVVVLADDVSRVAEAIATGQRTLRIARQSIWLGLGLSGAAMALAAMGMIPPTIGAVLQEAIDIVSILNGVRASRG